MAHRRLPCERLLSKCRPRQAFTGRPPRMHTHARAPTCAPWSPKTRSLRNKGDRAKETAPQRALRRAPPVIRVCMHPGPPVRRPAMYTACVNPWPTKHQPSAQPLRGGAASTRARHGMRASTRRMPPPHHHVRTPRIRHVPSSRPPLHTPRLPAASLPPLLTCTRPPTRARQSRWGTSCACSRGR